MLASELALLLVVGPLAARAVGGVGWLRTITGPLIAGAVMITVLLPLRDSCRRLRWPRSPI